MELTTIFISAIVSLIIVLLNNHFNTKNIKLRNNNSIDIEKNKFKYQNFHKNHERLLINAEKLHKILSKLQRDNSPSSSYQTFYRYTIKQLDNEYDNLKIDIDEARMLIELYFHNFIDNIEEVNAKAELFYDQKRKSILNKIEHNKIINQNDYFKEIGLLSSKIYSLSKLIKYELHKEVEIYNKTEEKTE